MTLTTNFHVVPRLRICGVMHLLSIHIPGAMVKNMHNLTLHSYLCSLIKYNILF